VTGKNPLLDIALKLEEVALGDPYFIDRSLYPNVDFYSGLIYQSMGFPVEMFTVLFAIGRTPGLVGALGRNAATRFSYCPTSSDLHRARRARSSKPLSELIQFNLWSFSPKDA